jgi:hypothetical protein
METLLSAVSDINVNSSDSHCKAFTKLMVQLAIVQKVPDKRCKMFRECVAALKNVRQVTITMLDYYNQSTRGINQNERSDLHKER